MDANRVDDGGMTTDTAVWLTLMLLIVLLVLVTTRRL